MIINFSNNNIPERYRTSSKGGNFIGFVVFAIFGLIFYHMSTDMIKKGQESLNWPKTVGVVMESEIYRSKDGEGKEIYSPNVTVQYNVYGNEYQTKQIDSSGPYSTSDFSSVQKVVAQYPKNKSVYVYYDNENHADALLEPGVSMFPRLLKGTSYLLFFASLYMLVKFLITLMVIGTIIVNFFTKKNIKNQNFNFETPPNKNPDITYANQDLGDNQIDNQDKKINFKDDGFSQ
ncbi:MAG: DUF3592 domain-containing protein [Proteobacteria bacterium]|nr:DUF3592 domain-containing protein [Pseudomonadota bacterium]NCA27872.1 DUF3592 domain-containing protein [Pseudomonadota bacterium]